MVLRPYSRLRDDAHLQYIYQGTPKGGRGRPKKYDGKVDYQNLKEGHITLIEESPDHKVYQAIVFSKALKRKTDLVMVYTNRKGGWKHKLYFSTDLQLNAQTVLEYYRTRFQMEFTFRDAKQHTGLDQCQARSEKKLHCHFNVALTTVNIAKVTHWIPIPKQERGAFSMADIKTLYHNQLLLNRFFSVFGIRPGSNKNKEKIRELIHYGARAA